MWGYIGDNGKENGNYYIVIGPFNRTYTRVLLGLY